MGSQTEARLIRRPNGRSNLRLDRYRDQDAAACLTLYRESIRRVASEYYDADQVDAWAGADVDLNAWSDRFNGRFAYVARFGDAEDSPVRGFGDMDATGYLDRLFVSPDHQRRGIATMVVNQVFRDATRHSIATVSTDASLSALAFFRRMRFDIQTPQRVCVRGVWMTNFRMRRMIESSVAGGTIDRVDPLSCPNPQAI